MICLLVGYILYGAAIHIVKVEDDFHEMQELKVLAEAADVAKSQVSFQDISNNALLTTHFHAKTKRMACVLDIVSGNSFS